MKEKLVEDVVDVSIVEFRARLKSYLNGSAVVRVKRNHRTCALLVPVPVQWGWGDEERKAVTGRIRPQVLRQLELLEKGDL